MKRFIDTDIWRREWYRKLTCSEKAFFQYLLCWCDAVGVWTPDKELAEFMLGAPIEWDAFPPKCNGNIEVLNNGKWWLVDFVNFQYGELKETCKPHRHYISLLKKHGLLKGYRKGFKTLQEKEKEKELELEKEKEKEKKKKYADNVTLSRTEYEKLEKKYGAIQTRQAIEKLSNAKGAKGYRYKSDYRALLNWVFDSIGATAQRAPPPKKIKPVPKVETEEGVAMLTKEMAKKRRGG